MASIGNIWMRLGLQDDVTKQSQSIFSGLQKTALKFGASFSAFKFLQTGITAASDLGETVNALNNIIGEESTAALQAFAQESAIAVGMAESEFLSLSQSFSGIMGDLVTEGKLGAAQIGELTSRVGDLGSMFNLTASELESGLMSALAGRTSQTLQKIGIDLSATALNAEIAAGAFEEMGIASNMTMAQLDNDTQILLRYTQFMRDSELAAGDFENTLGDSLPNQIKKLKAELTTAASNIMTNLLPSLVSAISMLGKMAEFLSRNATLVMALAGAFAGFKLGNFVAQATLAIAKLTGIAVAKTAAQTGIGALVAIPAVLAAIGAGVGIATSFGAFGGGSSSASTGSNSSVENQISIDISVDENRNIITNSNVGNVQSSYNA